MAFGLILLTILISKFYMLCIVNRIVNRIVNPAEILAGLFEEVFLDARVVNGLLGIVPLVEV